MRYHGSRCENVEGESKKSVCHTITAELTPLCVRTDREGEDDIDGQGDQGVEAEVSRHDGKRGSPKHCMGHKEGHRLEHWKQFGQDPDILDIHPGWIFLISIQVEGGVQVPFRAELRNR